MATYLAIAVVLLLPARFSLPGVIVLAAAITLLPQYVASWDMHGLQFGVGVPTLLVALAMFGLRSGFANTTALYQARQEVERLAAEQERLRIARDLHDLLGHSLTTVSVKAELAARLVDDRPASGRREEMLQVAELARQGLADVRATVTGYREISLIAELASAREVLARCGHDGAAAGERRGRPDAGPRAVRLGGAGGHHQRGAAQPRRPGRGRAEPDQRRGPRRRPRLHRRPGDRRPRRQRAARARRTGRAAGGSVTAGPRADGGFRLRVDLPAVAGGAARTREVQPAAVAAPVPAP